MGAHHWAAKGPLTGMDIVVRQSCPAGAYGDPVTRRFLRGDAIVDGDSQLLTGPASIKPGVIQ